jgi:hypothetical protein
MICKVVSRFVLREYWPTLADQENFELLRLLRQELQREALGCFGARGLETVASRETSSGRESYYRFVG